LVEVGSVDAECAVFAQPDGRQIAPSNGSVDGGDVEAQLERDLLRRQPQVALVDVCTQG
jgi:hypothetical protein